jgi:high-affinity Fe2+/Pb2+ permease
MKKSAALLSILGLALSTVPAFAVFYGMIDSGTYKQLLFVGMLVWFAAGGYWFRLRKSP